MDRQTPRVLIPEAHQAPEGDLEVPWSRLAAASGETTGKKPKGMSPSAWRQRAGKYVTLRESDHKWEGCATPCRTGVPGGSAFTRRVPGRPGGSKLGEGADEMTPRRESLQALGETWLQFRTNLANPESGLDEIRRNPIKMHEAVH